MSGIRDRRCRGSARLPALPSGRERGSASVLALGIVGVLIAVAASVLVVMGAFVQQRRAAVAVDAAALAAADVATGRVGGSPCVEAKRIAEAGGAALESCALDGVVASVTVSTGYFGLRSRAEARAGPPGTR